MTRSARGSWRLEAFTPLLVPLLAALVLVGAAPPSEVGSDDPGYGVYLRLVDGADGTVDQVADRLRTTAVEHGWEVLALHDVALPEGACEFQARLIVLNSPSYANALLAYGVRAAFAAPVRLAVFEDEEGVHVGAFNPRSLNRTIVDEGVPGIAWDPWTARIRNLALAAFPENASDSEYGQVRDRGRIGRTFGIMAGGPFEEQIEVIARVPASGTTPGEVADRLAREMGAVAGEWEWKIRPVFRMDIPDHDVAVVGVTSSRVEGDAFRIVGAGGVEARQTMACPGVDHAPAFPIEIVVATREDQIEVLIVDEMYRMKMFFEDAGKIAFAKNMGMPGSIEDEIRRKVAGVLGP